VKQIQNTAATVLGALQCDSGETPLKWNFKQYNILALGLQAHEVVTFEGKV
jgi:hypothetical protein